MDLTKEELNFLVKFFSNWANPFGEFDKSDIFRGGYPFGGPFDIDLGSLIRKKAISESPDGYKIRLTDYGAELMVDHMKNKTEWSKQEIIRVNLPDKDEIQIPKGAYYKGYRIIRDIFMTAQKSICLQDPYIGPDIFSTIQELNVEKFRLITGNKQYRERNSAIQAYKSLRKESDFIEMRISSKVHNRYIILDDKNVYQLGGSIKQLGDNDDIVKKVKDIGKIINDFESEWKTADRI